MKTCIWCKKTNDETPFEKKAHTIPKSLGGTNLCENVCDKCNHYFGNIHKRMPSIETVIKETFNISRARILHSTKDFGKNKSMPKFSSEYFKIDFSKKKPHLTLKLKYKLLRGFQKRIGRQMKRGIYKIFLEENERQFHNSLDKRFDFIREFARYDIGDIPVFYFHRKFGILLMTKDFASKPQIILSPTKQMAYVIQHESFAEFEFLGHMLGIAKSRSWELMLDNYMKKSIEAKKEYIKGVRLVKNFNDIDLTLSILN